ncbi:hypothetical protein [Elizabethkingia ursingii]|uniref:hypothetical protein n=1 Tax=Elizabethkingia ursingii TaxID=1756150 RepID=UPI0020127983|nr:hypothetical protein [Elizabethkingia ursingii]MCL1673602.1 hypothetical protein [Elizabethkingia ursingii]
MNDITYHQFDINLARKLSIEAAIIFNNICYWIDKNKANGKHFHQGRHWTYNSVKAFGELFPYMTRHVIDKSLKSLESEGYIVTGNFNESSYDRTKWFSVEQNIHLLKKRNGSDKIQNTIPDNKPNINTNNKQEQPQVGEDVFEFDLKDIKNEDGSFLDLDFDEVECLAKMINEEKEKSCEKKEKEIFDYYNINRNNMKEATVLSLQRAKEVRLILKDYGEDKVKQMIDKASKSDFLNGLVKERDFKAGFDWIFKPSNFIKILEGNYDNKLERKYETPKNRLRNR